MPAFGWYNLIFLFVFSALPLGAHSIITPRHHDLVNITIEVANGTTNHGDHRILCTPATWATFLTFYIGNFVAHSVTIISAPGQASRETFWNIFFALIYPNSGLIRGLDAIFSKAIFAKNPLQEAARSGALCVVVRKGSLQMGGADSRWWWFSDEEKRVLPERSFENIHGVCKQPEPTTGRINANDDAYEIVVLSRSSEIEPLKAEVDPSDLQLMSNHTIAQSFASVFQTLFAVYTLYRTRGSQLTVYGYTTFAFTVVPYAVMSLINFTGNIITPGYPKRYLIYTEDMDRAIEKGWTFDGIVGRVKSSSEQRTDEEEAAADHVEEGAGVHLGSTEDSSTTQVATTSEQVRSGGTIVQSEPLLTSEENTSPVPETEMRGGGPAPAATNDERLLPLITRTICTIFVYLAVSSVPFIIMGALTHFHHGDASVYGQGFLLSWYLANVSFAPIVAYLTYGGLGNGVLQAGIMDPCLGLGFIVGFLAFFVPPLAMFIITGQRLSEYGDCLYIAGS